MIKHLLTGEVLIEGETKAEIASAIRSGADLSWATLSGADLTLADLSGTNLSRADLTRADLSGADLTGANLHGANLTGATLSRANLSGADLPHADLSRADLYGASLSRADLYGASLYGANLTGANLIGTKLAWTSHCLLGHILFRAAGDSISRRKFAGLVSLSTDWCWDKFMLIEDEEKQWALAVLAGCIVPGDAAPDILREWAKAQLPPTHHAELAGSDPGFVPRQPDGPDANE